MLMFAVWITKVVREHQLEGGMLDDPNVVILCIPPHMKAQRYIKIKAYENQFCVHDASNTTIVIIIVEWHL